VKQYVIENHFAMLDTITYHDNSSIQTKFTNVHFKSSDFVKTGSL